MVDVIDPLHESRRPVRVQRRQVGDQGIVQALELQPVERPHVGQVFAQVGLAHLVVVVVDIEIWVAADELDHSIATTAFALTGGA